MYKSAEYLVGVLFFVVLLIALPRDVSLQHEWLQILEESSFRGGMKMYGMPTAYMPPLYAYFLMACRAVFGFADWIKISLILQGIVYFFSLRFLVKSFFFKNFRSVRIQLILVALLLFPPLFAGNLTISSFSLSVSLISVFFAILYRILAENTFSSKRLVVLAFVALLGLYLRYEFIYILLISGAALLYLRKINIRFFLAMCCFAALAYLPWMVRNYVKIGKFTYSTSLNYNFAKGYNQKYDVFSAYNFPYSPSEDEILPIEILYKKFDSEKDIDRYLGVLNDEFIQSEPGLFIKLTLQKLAVNVTQYFPDYGWISSYRLYIFYSIFFVLFQILLVSSLIKLKNRQHRYLFVFTLIIYLFALSFYSIAPMPRYFLLYLPFFALTITKTFLATNPLEG